LQVVEKTRRVHDPDGATAPLLGSQCRKHSRDA
jgi:hypothetical protein